MTSTKLAEVTLAVRLQTAEAAECVRHRHVERVGWSTSIQRLCTLSDEVLKS